MDAGKGTKTVTERVSKEMYDLGEIDSFTQITISEAVILK